MVKIIMDTLLYMGEITNHAIRIQFLGPAINSNDPIMPMALATFARIRQTEAMTPSNLHTFFDKIHLFLDIPNQPVINQTRFILEK